MPIVEWSTVVACRDAPQATSRYEERARELDLCGVAWRGEVEIYVDRRSG